VIVDREQIVSIVRAATHDLNAIQADDERLDPAEATTLAGEGGTLSSLALVTFILGVEERLNAAIGREISLFDEALLVRPDGPFRTIGSFVDHIHVMVRDTAS
jgi:hypothetical protein